MNGNEFDTSEVEHNTKGSSTLDEVQKTKKPPSKEQKNGQSEGESTSNQRQLYVLKACKSCKAAHVGKAINLPSLCDARSTSKFVYLNLYCL
jgi:hypothetical protein